MSLFAVCHPKLSAEDRRFIDAFRHFPLGTYAD